MTKVYTVAAPEGYEWVAPQSDKDFEALRFDGQSRAATWTAIKMRTLETDEHGRQRKRSDCPSCSGADMLMLRERAFDALAQVLRLTGEILPLECPHEPLWTLNVTSLIDALDEERSQLLKSPVDGHILLVKKTVFRSEKVATAPAVFKLTQTPRGLIYVTQPLVEMVRAADLQGITFKQVWAPD